MQLFVVLGGDPPLWGKACALGITLTDDVISEVLGPDDGIDGHIPFADDDFRSVEFRLAGSESSGRWLRFI